MKLNKREYIYILILSAAFFCCTFLFSQGGDMKLVIRQAFDLLDSLKAGRLFDYYSYSIEKINSGVYGQATLEQAPNYNYFIYLLVAVFMLPFRIGSLLVGDSTYNQNLALMWISMGILVATLYSGKLTFILAREFGAEKKQARMAMFIELGSIILLFSTVGFTQLDIIYVDMILFAMVYYNKNEMYKFSIIMSVAIMLKAFPILIFLPLLFLAEKKVENIIKYGLIGCGASVIFRIIVSFDKGYFEIQNYMKDLYGFTGRLFNCGLDIGYYQISFFVACFFVICLVCYDKTIENNGRWKDAIIAILAVYTSFTIFVNWHPQWLAMLAPVLALVIIANPLRRSNIYVIYILEISYLGVVFTNFYTAINNDMINNSILSLCGITFEQKNICDFLIQKFEYMPVLFSSLLAISLIYFTYSNYKDLQECNTISEKWIAEGNEYSAREMNWTKCIIALRPFTMIILTVMMYVAAFKL